MAVGIKDRLRFLYKHLNDYMWMDIYFGVRAASARSFF